MLYPISDNDVYAFNNKCNNPTNYFISGAAMNISVRNRGGEKLSIPYFPIDRVALTERATSFTSRSIKSDSKLDVLYLALSMIDLTTLEGMDTPGKVKQLCGKAIKPVGYEADLI